MQLFGLLKTFSVADALQWVANEKATGTLVFQQTRREKRVLAEDGQIVAGFSTDPLEFFGQILLVTQRVDEETLVRAIARCQKDGKLLGEVLTELGLMTADEVHEALRAHVENLICDLFLWKHGLFYFTPEDIDPRLRLEEPISTLGVVFEGARQIDEIGRLRTVLPHDDVVLRPGPHWPGEGLSPYAQRVASVANLQLSLRELRAQTGGWVYAFLETCVDLVRDEVLLMEDRGELHHSLEEISYLDVMLEQAVAERRASFGELLPIQLDLLKEMYPWVLEGDHEPAETPSAFVRSMDGQRPLRDLLSEDAVEQGEQLAELLLEMRQGAVALLPMAADQFADRFKRTPVQR